MGMHRGSVVWFNSAEGYGLLTYDRGPDVFVHYTAIMADGYETLQEGDPVEFDIVVDPAGKPQAANVYVVYNT